MRVFGILIMIVSALIVIISFFLQTSIQTDTTRLVADQGVLNLGLLQNQLMVFQLGLAGFLAGTILASVGAIWERMSSPEPIDVAPAPPPLSQVAVRTCDWCHNEFASPARPCSDFELSELRKLEIEGDECIAIVSAKLT